MDTKLVQEKVLASAASYPPGTTCYITPDQAQTFASFIKVLSDPHRIQIVNLLANTAEPVCVCDFMPQLGLSQGTVSFHLKKLLAIGLLEREERGTWAYYSLKPEGLDKLVEYFGTIFDKQEDET
jgi:ArsR family transcriptional regulator